MANYYTEFSFVIENVTDEEANWCLEEHKKDFNDWCEPDLSYDFWDFGLELEESELDGSKQIWIYSDGDTANVEALADFLAIFLEKFRPDDIIWFEWANTCSKLVLGSFGGGACVVSKEGQKFFDTFDWAYETQEEILKNREIDRLADLQD